MPNLSEILTSFLMLISSFSAGPILGAPAQNTFQKSLIPITDSTYYLGTTTPSTVAWAGGVFDQICLNGDCQTSWPSGAGGGLATTSPISGSNLLYYSATGAGSAKGVATTSVSCSGSVSCTSFTAIGAAPITITGSASGSGNVSTSTNETKGNLAYWTSTSGTPATVGEVATTTLTASSPLSLSNPVAKVGGSNSVLTIDTSGAWSGTAGSLAANGANCSAGNFPIGVDASGAVESCTDAWTEAENTAAAYISRTGLSATWPIAYNSGTGAFSWIGLATTSQPTSGQLLYSNGTTGLTPVSTTSVSLSSEFSHSGTLGAVVGGSAGTLSLATNGIAYTKLAQLAANSVLGNTTSASGNVTAIATSSLFQWTGTGQVVRETSPTFVTSALSPVFSSTAADPADAGVIRLGNAEIIGWEASPTGTDVSLSVNASEQLVLTGGGAIIPSANDGASLGVSGTAFSDLFLASGAVINFAAGNYTLTHSTGALSTSGTFGVGTTTPWALLSVQPNGISGPAFAVGSSTKTDFMVSNGGLVGIATSSPNFRFSLGTNTTGFYIDSTGKVVARDTANSWDGRLSPTRSFVLSTGTTTTWGGTTTDAYVPSMVMPFAGTLRKSRCQASTTQSFLGTAVRINTTAVTPTYFVSSTTVGTITYTANNTFTAGQRISAYFGTSTTDSNAKSITCTFDVTETP